MILPNKEPSYPHYFHALSPTEISSVKVTGDVEIGYIGFGSKGLHNHVMPNDLQCNVSIIAENLIPHNQQSNFSSFRFAARSSSWVQLDLCLPGGRGENHSFLICRQLILTPSRCSTMIGLPLPLSSPPVSLTGCLTPRTGIYSTVSSVSRTRSISLQQQQQLNLNIQ